MARQPHGKIEVDTADLRAFRRAVRQSTDRELPKRLGQANKSVGQLVIDRLQPRPDPASIGAGAGAAVRASASRREVVLRVGGKHRERDSLPKPNKSKARYALATWGRRAAMVPGPRPKRPNIRGTVERHRSEIEEAWIDATLAAMDGAFAATEKR